MAIIIEPLSLTIFGFDVTEVIGVKHDVEWTSFPAESGFNISDHAIIAPDELTLKGMVTDHPLSGVPTPNRAHRAYEQLVALRERRRLVTVVCDFGVFTDMGIASVQLSRTVETGAAIAPEVSLRKVRIVQSVTIPVPTEILAPKALGAASPVWTGSVHTALDPTQMAVRTVETEGGDLVGAYSMQDLGGELGSSYFPRPGEVGAFAPGTDSSLFY